MGGYSVTDPTYQALSSSDDDPRAMLRKIISPTSAAELVGPPPDSPPAHQPGQSTPLTGNLAAAPRQAIAKNLDTALGRQAYNTQSPIGGLTGTSNPPDGGNVRSIVNPVQPAQSAQPAQATQPLQPLRQPLQQSTVMNPGRSALVSPGSTTPVVSPALPAQAPPSQLDLAQNRLNTLTSTGPGVSQIKNGFARGAARVGDSLLSAVLPGVAPFVGGTTARNQMLIQRQQGVVGNLQGQQQAAAALADTQQKTQLDAAKTGANAERPVTADEARAAGNPALEGSVMRPSDIGKLNVQGTKNTGLAGVQAEKLGLKKNDDGSYAEDPSSPMTQVRKSKEDLESAQENLANAKADVAAAGNNPGSPAYRLAQQKLAVAQQGHSAAMMRAQAAMGNYLMHSRGVGLDNQALPGQFQITGDDGKTTGLGTTFQKPVSDQQSRVAQFNDVFGALDNFEGTAKALAKAGGKLNDPQVAAALADPHSTSAQWAQGAFANSGLSPAQRNYVIAKKSFDENLQAMRKSAGGTATDAAVNRLAAMAPGAQTPDLDYFLRQTGQIRQTAKRLSTGIPNVKGGHTVNTGTPDAKPGGQLPGHEVWVRGKDGKLVKQ